MEDTESKYQEAFVSGKEDQQAASDHHSSQPKISDDSEQKLEVSKTGKKYSSRRRKGVSKPRKIQQAIPDLALEANHDNKAKSLDSVLQRVLKAKQVDKLYSSQSISTNSNKMIEVHETLAIHHHHHSPKPVRSSTRSPGSVDSPTSLYSTERAEDNMSDNNAHQNVEPFVKIRPRSGAHVIPETIPPYEMDSSLQRPLSPDTPQRKRSVSPFQAESPKDNQNFSVTSPLQIAPSPAFMVSSSGYNAMNGNPLAAVAAEMGLPTMIPTSAIMTSTMSPLMTIQQQQFLQENGTFPDNKKQEAPLQNMKSCNSAARGIIGSSGNAPRFTASPSPEDRAQYKRPPHTYPALIASAILDSPGHLITLRGIYDYIMNHFPYYKYCHDKSAWQNSIRHNLSLNQCFVKVPRYENAAKSNYWTMTREGFEEFGNENSFKRRRRRGAALAPISAYKAKKYQNEAKNNKNKVDARNHSSTNSTAMTNGSDEGYHVPFHPHLMGLAGAWPSGFRPEENTAKSRKRSQSPLGKEEIKHPRMLVLKQGDGPSLGGIKGEEQKRPNSLSSVEEMQGTLNSFSKTLLDSSMLSKAPFNLLSSTSQPWMAATQKNLMATSGMLMPSLIQANRASTPSGKSPAHNASNDEGYNPGESPVMMDGVQIGYELVVRYDSSEAPTRHFRCQFCPYTDSHTSEVLLEQHVRVLHPVEVTNAQAKAVAAAAVAKSQKERLASEKSAESQERLMSLQSMISSLTPGSVMAACQSSAQSLLAAAQAGASNGTTGFPYSGTFSSGLLDESVMRSFAEQVATSQANGDHDNGLPNMDAFVFQRQVLNNVIQQAAAASASPALSQEQLRLFYQQFALHNPFLANSANSLNAAFSRQVPTSSNQQLWQYQQKLFSQMKALSDDSARNISSPSKDEVMVNRQNSSSPSSDADVDMDSKKISRDMTSRDDQDLKLHHRKNYSESNVVMSSDEVTKRTSPNSIAGSNETASRDCAPQSSTSKFEEHCNSPLASSAFPTPPLSNSPSYAKRHFAPLDLSGVKEEELRKSPGAMTTASTQTAAGPRTEDDSSESRTCNHCNIVFGDEMMHALHMSCHDKTDPFKCTICGQKCNEKYYFNVHVLRGLHQANSNNANSKPEQFQEDAACHENDTNTSRRHSNSSDTSSVTSRGRLSSDNSDTAPFQQQ